MIRASIPWSDVEYAIHWWFSDSTGLHTSWANSDGPQRRYPFAVLDIIAGPTPVSFFKQTEIRTIDGCDYTCVGGPMEFTINAQVLVGGKAGNDPDQYAREYMTGAIIGLKVDRYSQELGKCKVINYDIEPTLDISEEVGTERISRVSTDFQFRQIAEFCLPVDEFGGCIEKVQLRTALDADKTFIVEKATCQQVAQ